MTRTLMVMGAAVLACTVVIGQQQPAAASLDKTRLEAAINKEVIDGDLKGAMAIYDELTRSTDRTVAAQAYLRLGQGYGRLGDPQAKASLQRALEFKDQPAVVAKARAALGLRNQAAGGASSGPSMRRVWAGKGVDTSGGVSPDGRFISFVDPDTGDLAIRDLNTGENRRVTAVPSSEPWSEFAEASVFSPDGRQLAYGWWDSADKYHLRTVAVDAAGPAVPRTVYSRTDLGWCDLTDWSRDGKWLAVACGDESSRARLARLSLVDGSLLEFPETLQVAPTRFLFSPDGRFVAFDMLRDERGDDRDVVVQRIDDGRRVFVAPGPGYEALMAWSPDGTQVIFSSDRSGTTSLWAVSVNLGVPSGLPRQLHSGVSDTTLGITKDGQLFLGVEKRSTDIHVASIDVATGARTGEPTRPIERQVGGNRNPLWSSDGAHLFFTSLARRAGQSRVLAVMDVRSGHVRELRTRLNRLYFPALSPDGRTVAVQGRAKEGSGIFLVAVDTAAVTPVVIQGPDESVVWPTWSPDGTRVIYTRNRGAGRPSVVVERNLEAGTERTLATLLGGRMSPDGRYLAAINRNREAGTVELKVVPVNGGDARVLHSVERPAGLSWPSWTPDGKHVLFKHVSSTPVIDEALAVPIDGGKPTRLVLPGVKFGFMSMHPDGKQIAYLAGEDEEEVWVLENFLPGTKAVPARK